MNKNSNILGFDELGDNNGQLIFDNFEENSENIEKLNMRKKKVQFNI